MGMNAEASGAAAKTRVFLSYSRKDSAFTRRLATALDASGYAPIFDQSERPHDDPDLQLTAQDEWWRQLKAMIAAADVMVFVVSPDSAESRVCDDEIAHARALGKRVIGIERRAVDYNTAPERLRALNVKLRFSADEGEGFDAAFAALRAALDTNIDWRRRGAHWTRLAERWATSDRAETQLLASGAVDDADQWAATRPANEPEPGPLVLEFLEASRKAAREHRERLLTITGRAFVKPAEQAVAEGRYDAALRLAAAGTLLAEDLDMQLVPERMRATMSAAERSPLRSILVGHKGAVTDVLFSPDGARLITTSSDGTARVWDVSSGETIFELLGNGNVTSAACSPDGEYIVIAGGDSKPFARLWSASSGIHLAELPVTRGVVQSAVFSPDSSNVLTSSFQEATRVWDVSGREIATLCESNSAGFSRDGKAVFTASHDQVVRVWDTRTWAERMQIKVPGKHLTHVAFSSDGSRIVTIGGNDHTAHVWDARSGAAICAVRHNAHLNCASLDRSGSQVVVASSDNTACVYEVSSGRPIAVLRGHASEVRSAFFSPDNKSVVTASLDGTARIWDATLGSELSVLRGHEGYVFNAVYSSSGTIVATASGDGTARIWDAALTRRVAKLNGHKEPISCASFNSDGTRLVTASHDCTARIWDLSTGRSLATLNGHEKILWSASYSRDGMRIVTASGDCTARIWDAAPDVRDGEREVAVLRGHQNQVKSACFNPDCTRVVTTSFDGTARVWDAVSGQELLTLRGHEDVVWGASIASDGAWIATASSDKTGRIWDANTGAAIAVLRGHGLGLSSISFSTNGTRVVTGSADQTGRVWDCATGSELAELRGHLGRVNNASFGADDAWIVTASGDNTARVWAAASGREVSILNGHLSGVKDAAFSSDGARVVTGSLDGTARIWDAASGREIACLGGEDYADSVSFDSSAERIVVAYRGGTALVADVARTTALTGNLVEILAASLANGRGMKTESERADLLMQAAPDDLYEALMERLTPEQRENVARRAEILARPLHPNCYLPPSARPGYAPPAEAVSVSASAEATPVEALAAAADKPARSVTPMRQKRGALLFFIVLVVLAALAASAWMFREQLLSVFGFT